MSDGCDDCEKLEVVWTGDMELLPPREQRPDPTWVAPKKQVNKNRKPFLERKGTWKDGENGKC